MLILIHGEVNTPTLEYLDIPDKAVAELNRRTRFRCDKEFIVRIHRTDLRWFEQDVMPADAWELNEGKDLEAEARRLR